jgi:hypothetical protein
MATASQVKVGLDDIAGVIAAQRDVMKKAKSNAALASAALAALGTSYADVITTIGAYGTSDAFENVSKAEYAKLLAEFNALKAIADGVAGINV